MRTVQDDICYDIDYQTLLVDLQISHAAPASSRGNAKP
jgi:hypothetical protein